MLDALPVLQVCVVGQCLVVLCCGQCCLTGKRGQRRNRNITETVSIEVDISWGSVYMQPTCAIDAAADGPKRVVAVPKTHEDSGAVWDTCGRGDGVLGPYPAMGRGGAGGAGSGAGGAGASQGTHPSPSTPPRNTSVGGSPSLTSRLSSGGRRLTSLLVESPRKASRYLLRGAARPYNADGGVDSGSDGDASTSSRLGSPAARNSGGPSTGKHSKQKPFHRRDNRGTLRQCPPEVMYLVFQLLMQQTQSFGCILPLSLVCRYWYHLTQHRTMWLHVAKQFFVAYPVVQRLTRAAPIDAEEEAAFRRLLAYRAVPLLLSATATPTSATTGGPTMSSGVRRDDVQQVENPSAAAPSLLPTPQQPHNGAWGGGTTQVPPPSPLSTTMEPPSNQTIRKGLKDLKKYIARRRYHELVQRRRAFVIHAFFSLALLCMSMTLLTAMCAAERLDPITVCNHETSFHFLWLTFLSIFGAVISNIVMETHFEPQPLIRRLRMHTQLIQVSAGALSLGMLFIGLPALLIQWNVRDKTMQWIVCLGPVLLALLLWQVEVLVSVRADIQQFMHRPYFNTMTMYHGFSNSTPTLFIIALWCLAEYLERGGAEEDWLLLFLGTLPGGLSLFTLTIVFLLDYSLKNQSSDFVAGMSMAVANVCPILIATTHRFRGYMLLPIVLAAFGFFVGHFNDLRKRLDAAMFDPDGERMLFDED